MKRMQEYLRNRAGSGSTWRLPLNALQQTRLYEAILKAQSDVGEGFLIIEGRRIIYANDASVRISGYTPEELTRLRSFFQLVVPEQRPVLLKRLTMRLAGFKVPDHYETAILHKDRHRVDIEVAVRLIRLAGRIQLAVIVHDITERKRAEQSVQKLSAAIGDTADSVVITNRDGTIEYVNPAFEAMTGYRAADVIGQNPRLWKSGKHERAFYQRLWEMILAGKTFRAEFMNKKKNGDLYFEHQTISPVKDATGAITHFISTGRDITERKETERTLRRHTIYLTVLHDIALALTRRIDSADLLKTIVERAGHLVGTDHGYIYLASPDDKELIVKVGTGVFQDYVGFRLRPGEGLGGLVWQQAEPIAIADYDTWPGRAPAFPRGIFHAAVGVPLSVGEKVVGVVVLTATEPGRHFGAEEVEILSRFADLAAVALENARLLHDVQDALRIRDEFLSIAAHELKSPVTALKASAQMLQRSARWRGSSPEEQDDLAVLERQVNRLSRLVSDVLDLSRLESGLLEFHRRTVDLAVTVDRVVERMRAVAGSRQIAINGPASLLVRLDPDRIEQVLVNLLSNAINHSPGKSRISISIRKGAKEVIVSVRDRGEGIPKDKQRQLFQRFSQVESKKSRGLGLGLYIAKQIIDQHHGRIWVASQLGKGSTFSFAIPLRRES